MNLDGLLNECTIIVYSCLLMAFLANFFSERKNKTIQDYFVTNKIYNFSIQIVILFCFMNNMIDYGVWTDAHSQNHLPIVTLRLIAGLLGVGLMLKDYWPAKIEKYFSKYWRFAILYCLPFNAMVKVLATHGEKVWLINLCVAIFLLSEVVGALLFMVFLILGIGMGSAFYFFILQPNDVISQNLLHLITYVIIISALFGILLARRKEIAKNEKLEVLKLFAESIAHEVKSPLAVSSMNAQILAEITDNIKDNKIVKKEIGKNDFDYLIEKIPQTLLLSLNRSVSVVNMLVTSLKSKIEATDKGIYSIKEIITEAIDDYHLTADEKNRISIKIISNFKIYGSKEFFKQALFNLIRNTHKYAGNHAEIEIRTYKNKLFFHDNGKGIDAKILPYIFDRFYTTSDSGPGIGLAFCKSVMKIFGGKISCRSKKNAGCTFILSFNTSIPKTKNDNND